MVGFLGEFVGFFELWGGLVGAILYRPPANSNMFILGINVYLPCSLVFIYSVYPYGPDRPAPTIGISVYLHVP